MPENPQNITLLLSSKEVGAKLDWQEAYISSHLWSCNFYNMPRGPRPLHWLKVLLFWKLEMQRRFLCIVPLGYVKFNCVQIINHYHCTQLGEFVVTIICCWRKYKIYFGGDLVFLGLAVFYPCEI